MQEHYKDYIKEIISYIKKEKPNKIDLSRYKIKLCSKYHLKDIPNDIKILMSAPSKEVKHIEKFLSIKPVRTISGVSVVAIMTKPLKCPGTCIYCPGGVNSFYGNTPKSYTGKEPAARRAARNHFDAYLQVFNRLEHYIVSGHVPDKVELIVMGATFSAFTKAYQEEFIYYAFKAMNDFSELFYYKNGKLNFSKFKKFFELPTQVNNSDRTHKIHNKLLELKCSITNVIGTEKHNKNKHYLKKEQKINESTKIRCVGLTIETRPDYADKEIANNLLRLGATRIELGIQSVYENVLKKVNRGHTVKQSVKAISILRDLGFKLNFHIMPGLPGVNTKKDLQGLKKLFSSQEFRPDMLKIYPCMVMPGTKLYQMYKDKKFKPLTTKKAASLIANFKKFVPKYVRIMRVQRDIPSNLVFAGVNRTNLRQYVDKELKKKNIKCNCIRCREIRSEKITKPELNIIKYDANNGTELFISIADKNKIVGFCRLRFPYKQLRKEFTKKTAIIRELHVYGETTSLGEKGDIQHKGFGKILLKTAEEICKENNYNKLLVISGVGVREYYFKSKYKLEGPYMSKKL